MIFFYIYFSNTSFINVIFFFILIVFHDKQKHGNAQRTMYGLGSINFVVFNRGSFFHKFSCSMGTMLNYSVNVLNMLAAIMDFRSTQIQ